MDNVSETFSMQEDQIPPNKTTTPPSPLSTKKSKWPLLGGVLLLLLMGAGTYYSITQKSNSSQVNMKTQRVTTPSPVTTSFPSVQNNKKIATIGTRGHVSDQKNLSAANNASSGFLNPLVLKKKQARSSDSTFIHRAYAAEGAAVHPFLFYLHEYKQVKAFDIADGIEYELLDVRDIPNIVTPDKAVIHNMQFLNSAKKIVFSLIERLDNNPNDDETLRKNLEQYKMSLNVYDIQTKQTTQLISITGKVGESMEWQDFVVSPDEKDLFVLYSNVFDNPQFADIAKVPTDDNRYYNQIYIFSNLLTNIVSKFRLPNKITGVTNAQWDETSQSILFRYNDTVNSETAINFNRIYSDGKNTNLVRKQIDREFNKSVYLTGLNKIFYISTGSNKNSDTFHDELFGYLDLSTNEINDINTPEVHTSQFTYDFNGGVIYNTFTRNNGVVAGMTLSRYDTQTKQSKQLTNNNAIIVNFNGDYTHLLIGVQSLPNTVLYDLDLITGEQIYLTTVPTILSVYQ